MKVRNLLTRASWLGLALVIVAVLTMFKLSPSWAHSNTTPVEQSLAGTTLIAENYVTTAGSLYERLGGYNAIAKVIDDTLENVLGDPLIGKYFIGLSTNSKQRLRQLLVDQFTQATGGPSIYTGRTMKVAHSGIGGGLTNDEFNAFYNDVAAALDKNGVPQPEKDQVLAFVNSTRKQIVER